MAHYEIRISGDTTNPEDLRVFGLIAGQQIPAGPGPAPADINGLSAADEPKRAVRQGKKAVEGSKPDETAASPATEPPTPKVQQTAEQQKAVDPDVAAAQGGGDTGAPGSAQQGNAAAAQANGQSGAAATTNSDPANSAVSASQAGTAQTASPSDQVGETTGTPAATAPGDVTLDDLKVLLTKAMGFNAAKTLQDVIRATAGVPGLSQAEAKDYPALHAALLPYSEGEVKPA